MPARIHFPAALAIALLFFPVLASRAGEFGNRHAILFGIDGLRADALKTAVENRTAPNIAGLIEAGTVTWTAYAGGDFGTPGQQPTVSGPGWSSVLTGVWTDKHGVTDNSFKGGNFSHYPSLFERLGEVRPQARCASLVSWDPIHEHIVTASPADGRVPLARHAWPHEAGSDEKLIEETIREISANDPDLTFCYQGDVDGAGHQHGFSPGSPEYMAAIETADSRIGQVLAAVRGRADFAAEDWMFVVATDHGGKGTKHGGQSPEERTIPLIVAGGGAAKGAVSTESPGQTCVPATLFRFLGVDVPAAWGWDPATFPRKIGKDRVTTNPF
jgi:hypothetical protein